MARQSQLPNNLHKLTQAKGRTVSRAPHTYKYRRIAGLYVLFVSFHRACAHTQDGVDRAGRHCRCGKADDADDQEYPVQDTGCGNHEEGGKASDADDDTNDTVDVSNIFLKHNKPH